MDAVLPGAVAEATGQAIISKTRPSAPSHSAQLHGRAARDVDVENDLRSRLCADISAMLEWKHNALKDHVSNEIAEQDMRLERLLRPVSQNATFERSLSKGNATFEGSLSKGRNRLRNSKVSIEPESSVDTDGKASSKTRSDGTSRNSGSGMKVSILVPGGSISPSATNRASTVSNSFKFSAGKLGRMSQQVYSAICEDKNTKMMRELQARTTQRTQVQKTDSIAEADAEEDENENDLPTEAIHNGDQEPLTKSVDPQDSLKKRDTNFSTSTGKPPMKQMSTDVFRIAAHQEIEAQNTKRKMKRGITEYMEAHTKSRFWQLCSSETCQKVSSHHLWELFFGILILSNTVWIGVELDYTTKHPDQALPPLVFFAVGYLYTFLFFLELLVKLLADARTFLCTDLDKLVWNYLDVVIVVSSLLEVALDIYQMVAVSGSSHVDVSNLRIIRIIRLVRLMRLFRIGRIVRFVRALRILVLSIVHTLKSVFWSMLLLTMIIYLFGILLTQGASNYLVEVTYGGLPARLDERQTERLVHHWGTLADAMLSLYMAVSGGVSWYDIARPLREVSTLWLTIFVVYIGFVYFAVLNVVTGIFCQSAIESTQADHESMIQTFLMNQAEFTQKLRQLFESIALSSDGMLTKEDFLEHIKDRKVQGYLATLDIQANDAVNFFNLLAENGASTDSIDIEDFIVGCMRLKGPAKSYEMSLLLHDMKYLKRDVDELREVLGETPDRREEQLRITC